VYKYRGYVPLENPQHKFGKSKYYPDVHDRQRNDLGALLAAIESQRCMFISWNCIM